MLHTVEPPVGETRACLAATSKMSPIKDFDLVYVTLNKDGIFSEGDIVAGLVTFTLTKETKVKSLRLKYKADASVKWSSGDTTYIGNWKYFNLKDYLIAEKAKGTVLPQGVYRFVFMFKLPDGNLPTSFKGSNGKIAYTLEAKITRSWRWPTEIQTELNFVSKSLPRPDQCPQSASVGKVVGVFSKGEVQISATVNRKVCSPGDTLSVVAKIRNSSSKQMRPKFSLQQKTVYRVKKSTDVHDKTLYKMVGETIPANSEETVSGKLKIPPDATYTVHNCEILSVEYYLKVYLDVSFAFDPEVVFPLVVVPSSFATPQPGEAAGPYPAEAVGAPSGSDFPPPALLPGQGACGY